MMKVDPFRDDARAQLFRRRTQAWSEVSVTFPRHDRTLSRDITRLSLARQSEPNFPFCGRFRLSLPRRTEVLP